MQRYQTEDEHRKAMRAKINKTIKRGKRRKRIIRRLRKAVPGICIGVLIAGMGAWCIAAPLPDPDDYEPYQGIRSISGKDILKDRELMDGAEFQELEPVANK